MIIEKKLIEEMAEELENCYGRETELTKRVREHLNQPESDNWIPCSDGKNLPEEPTCGLNDMDELQEYIVMIEGATAPTVLKYAGDGEWYADGVFYRVIAWQPLPEPYKGGKEIWKD